MEAQLENNLGKYAGIKRHFPNADYGKNEEAMNINTRVNEIYRKITGVSAPGYHEQKQSKQNRMYNILEDCLRDYMVIESMPKEKRTGNYLKLAGVYKKLGQMLGSEKGYNAEVGLFNALAVIYAKSAMQYSDEYSPMYEQEDKKGYSGKTDSCCSKGEFQYQ